MANIRNYLLAVGLLIMTAVLLQFVTEESRAEAVELNQNVINRYKAKQTSENSISNLVPLDGEQHVRPNISLSWSGSANGTYQVAFGTSNPPPIVATVTEPGCDASGGSGGLLPGIHDTIVAGRPAGIVVGNGYDDSKPTRLVFYLHGDIPASVTSLGHEWDLVVQFIQEQGWIYVLPLAPQTESEDDPRRRWYAKPQENLDFLSNVFDEMFTKYNICRETLLGGTGSGGSVFYGRTFFPYAGHKYPAYTIIQCGGGLWASGAFSESRKRITQQASDSDLVAHTKFNFTYGSEDFLAEQSGVTYQFYTDAGFRTIQDEIAGAGHCDYGTSNKTISFYEEAIAEISMRYRYDLGPLDYGTSYYWQITQTNDNGTVVHPLATFHTFQNQIYVDADAAGAADGRSWQDAYTSLQDALQAAHPKLDDPAEIWVAEGVYKPSNIGDQGASFELKENVLVYGGFSGTETERSQRDVINNPTILSGDLLGNDNDVLDLTEPTRADNSYHVVTIADSGMLDGVIVTGGNTDVNAEEFFQMAGGGIQNLGIARLTNVIIARNSANVGGGVYSSGNIHMANVIVVNNEARWRAGGLYHSNWREQEHDQLVNTLFYGNNADFYTNSDAGAIYSTHSEYLQIANSIIWGNNTSGQQLLADEDGLIQISHSIIEGSYDGDHNFDTDPLFVDPDGIDDRLGTTDDDFRLQTSSPAIDAGNNDLVPSHILADITANNARFIDHIQPNTAIGTSPIVDLGAYEAGSVPVPTATPTQPPTVTPTAISTPTPTKTPTMTLMPSSTTTPTLNIVTPKSTSPMNTSTLSPTSTSAGPLTPTPIPTSNSISSNDDLIVQEETYKKMYLPVIVKQILDSDNDGIGDIYESGLGLDATNPDSDCDGLLDGEEVGSDLGVPFDDDGDGIINALESSLLDSDRDGLNDHKDNETVAQTSCARFMPFAIANNNHDSSRVEIRVIADNVTQVAITPDRYGSVTVDGNNFYGKFIELYDDGTHGDRIANDGLWTRNNFTSDITFSESGERYFYPFSDIIITTNNTEVEVDRTYDFAHFFIGVVNQADLQTPIALNDDVQITSNLVNIVDSVLAARTTFYSSFFSDMQAASQRFYQYFTDDYDFLAFVADMQAASYSHGTSSVVSNSVRNIGQEEYSRVASYGSMGTLQSIIYLNLVRTTGPTLHEIIHRFTAPSELIDLGFSQCSDGGHWGVSGIGYGKLGGFDPSTLVDNGDGTYTVDAFSTFASSGELSPYVPLELYLAGLLDAKEVPNMKIPVNVDCQSLDFSVSGLATFRADSISNVSIEDVQTVLGGPREPGFSDSQKEFRMAMVIISRYKLNAAEMTFVNEWSKRIGRPVRSIDARTGRFSFADATHGIGTMDTTIRPNTPE